MKPKIILAAGMMRSGSTWQYNVIRLALINAGYKVYGCWVEDYDPKKAEGMDYVVVKLHTYMKKWVSKADMIFTTFRDARSIEESCKRVGIKGKIKDHYKNHLPWMLVSHHITSYNMIEWHMEAEVGSICFTLINGDYAFKNSRNIYHKVLSLLPPEGEDFDSGYDPITLLHPKHIKS